MPQTRRTISRIMCVALTTISVGWYYAPDGLFKLTLGGLAEISEGK
jgi:hypothetical protein